MRMKRFWRNLKGGGGSKDGDRPRAEVPPKSPLTQSDNSVQAAAPGGERDICTPENGSKQPEPPTGEPPSTVERTSPYTATCSNPAVPLQASPGSPGSSPQAPSEEGEPERGAAPDVQGESILPQDTQAWGFPVARTSRWQVDVSRLSGARRALREVASESAESTPQSSSDAVPCLPREASLEVSSPLLRDHEPPALGPAVCLSDLPACPAGPLFCNGGLCESGAAPLEGGPAERSLEALVLAAVRAREESASRAAAVLAAAAHLDVVLRAARVSRSVQALGAGGPPQAALQALLTLREEGQGQLGLDRPACAAAWVEAALAGGLASPPPPLSGARLTWPTGASRTAVAPSSPALAAGSLSGGGRHGTRRAGAVVTTPAPSLMQSHGEGQSPARRWGEFAAAGPGGDDGQPHDGDHGRVSALSGACETREGTIVNRCQQDSSMRPASEAASAEHTGEALSAAGIRPGDSGDGGPCLGAVGPALEARVREGAERQLVALVERVLIGVRDGPPGTGRSSSQRAARESLALLHRAHRQLAEMEASSADHAVKAKAATARDEVLKHLTAYVNIQPKEILKEARDHCAHPASIYGSQQ